MDRPESCQDTAVGRTEPSPAARLLGWSLRASDPDAGRVEVGFQIGDEFRNPVGLVHGGFLAAMLDDTCGPALLATLGPDEFPPTVSLTVQFLAPARPGRFVGRGQVVKRGKRIAFVHGELFDGDGALVATAESTMIIQSRRPS